ncbi:MAG TPA: hypothetical protein VM782_15820, partial [Stellaceae bacterium]|nr:hypothetical protein [Stellaceae bacterium]
MEASAMEASVEIAAVKAPLEALVEAAIVVVVKEPAPKPKTYGKTIPIIEICISIIIGRIILVLPIILVIPSLVSLTILRIIRVVAINGGCRL